MTLGELLANAPLDAVYVEDGIIPRDALLAAADALGGQLAAAGVAPGQVVAVMLPNTELAIAALFGVWRADAVYAPLNPRAADQEVRTLLATLAPAAIVTTEELASRFVQGGGSPSLLAGSGLRWKVLSAGAVDVPSHDPDVALVQFTSGTTGRPKPVPMRHTTVLDLINRFIPAPEPGSARRPPRPNIVPVSLSLWAGIYQVLFAFRRGAAVVLMDRFDPAQFAELVQRFEIRTTVLPPAALAMLTDEPAVTDLTPLRTVRSITAPLSPVQARRFHERFGVVVVNSYGQTELGGQVVGWSADDERRFADSKLGSVGRALSGIELRISEGEVLVRTPATTGGLIDAAFADRLDSDGWFRTGDLGSLDPEGFLWLEGRVSDMINRGGNKIFPAQVEEVLAEAPNVREASVVGVPDDRLGEVPWAFVAARGGQLDESVLLEWCRDRLTPYKIPVRIVQVGQLPRNEVGKVLKRDLAFRAASLQPRGT